MTILQQNIQTFLDNLAAGLATPGGGTTAALTGAHGAALVCMVCRLTIGRKKFAALEPATTAVLNQAESLRDSLSRLAPVDIEAVEALMAVYRLPNRSPRERVSRKAAIQTALRAATHPPLDVAAACGQVIDLCRQITGRSNPNALGDLLVGQICAEAGLKAASISALLNLDAIDDHKFVVKGRARIDRLLSAHNLTADVTTLLAHHKKREPN